MPWCNQSAVNFVAADHSLNDAFAAFDGLWEAARGGKVGYKKKHQLQECPRHATAQAKISEYRYCGLLRRALMQATENRLFTKRVINSRQFT